MKNNISFFSIVLMLLLASSIVLIGGMYVIAAENGEAKVYDMGSQISADSNIIADDDTPTSQTELQKKFGAMYDISEDGKTITVISKEYLDEFWHSNYEKEVIHALTTEEVYFIIQDSIRIYMEYDKVILTGFAPSSSTLKVTERFPVAEEREVCRPAASPLDRDKIKTDIHTIIMYRLKTLSSPKAFFTGADAISFVGGDPASYDGMYPESVFYIPGYSSNTDRDYILSIMGSTSFTDLGEFTDLFEVSEFGGDRINLFSPANGTITEVFPDESIYEISVPDGFDKDNPVVNKPDSNKYNNSEEEQKVAYYFRLDITNGMCSLITSNSKIEAEGTYVHEGDAHVLYFDSDYQYVFYYNEGVGYEYAKAESNPIPTFEFENDKLFLLDDTTLFPIG